MVTCIYVVFQSIFTSMFFNLTATGKEADVTRHFYGTMSQATVPIREFNSNLTHFCDKGYFFNLLIINGQITYTCQTKQLRFHTTWIIYKKHTLVRRSESVFKIDQFK